MKILFSTKNKLIIFLLLLSVPWATSAVAGFGDLQAGARSMGMGGAFTGLADDASAILTNPAGLGGIQYLDILVNYDDVFAGLTQGSVYSGYAGIVVPSQSLGHFGVGFYQRGTSVNDESLYDETVMALSYARPINVKFSLGLTAKMLRTAWNFPTEVPAIETHFNGDDGKSAMDLDLGIMYRPFENFTLGFALENVMATDMAINSNSTDKLDRIFKPGVAFRIGEKLNPYVERYPATIVAEVMYTNRDQRDNVSRFQIGAEGWLIGDGIMGLRVGYSTGDEDHASITMGASFRLTPIHPGLQLDYGFQDLQGQSIQGVMTHRFALRFNNVPVIKPLDRDQIRLALVADPNMFSPNMDGRMDVMRLRPTAPSNLGIQSWTVKIFTKNTGDLVRTYEGQGLPPLELTWRGKDDNGMELPDGEYYGLLQVVTAFNGNLSSPNTDLILDTTAPEASARAIPKTFMPLNEDGTLPNATEILLSANDALAGTEAWSLFIRKKGERENFASFTGRGAPSEPVLWDGSDKNGFIDPEGGAYVFVLEAVDKVGNRAWTEPNEVYTSTMVRAGAESGTMQMVHEKIFFDFDQATIKPESYPVLDRIVRELEKFADYSLVISAHTDHMGSDEYNLDLSQRRAESVMEYLKQRDAIRRVLEAKGYGESRPIDTNETEEGRARNRRVELVLVPR